MFNRLKSIFLNPLPLLAAATINDWMTFHKFHNHFKEIMVKKAQNFLSKVVSSWGPGKSWMKSQGHCQS